MPPFVRVMLASLPLFVLVAPTRAADPSTGDEFFEKKIRPLLVENCLKCHGATEKIKGGLKLDSRASLLRGGDTGPAIVPDSPDKSLLLNVIGYSGDIKMPPRGKLTDAQIADLTTWVKMGSPWPKPIGEVGPGTVKEFNLTERAKHWSFQPVQPVAIPSIKDNRWVRSPIDAFILRKLDEAGLKPAPTSDKRTWIRRVTIDLVGLPPTRAEIDAFLKDETDEAFAKVVDRLLQSPQYGERWARHWLDLVRFAETAGHEFDFEMAEAWRYRDYVIRAMNADLPYDQFVIEHLAGDLLPQPRLHPKERFNESILGTGFWFFGESKHSPVDIRGDEADRVDNQIDVFGKTFLGLTISCARCHDHKFDAITTQDYYSVAGFLQSSRYQRAFIDDPTKRREIITQLDALRTTTSDAARDESVRVLREFIATPDWMAKVAETADPLWKKLFTAADPKSVREELKSVAKNDRTFEDFDRGDYAGWFATGEAFGTAPTQAGERTFGGPLLTPGIAHSGRSSNRLQGVLRSKTFKIDSDFIFYRIAGTSGHVNLIIDSFQQIRAPIYGGLAFGVSHDFRWVAQDVRMWKGHMAYIELIDDNDGFIAVDQIVTGDRGPQPRLASELEYVAKLLESPESAKAIRTHAETIINSWANGKFDRLPQVTGDIQFLNAMLAAVRLATDPWTAPRAEYNRLTASLPLSRRAMAMCDGTPENERVFIRGNHKSLGTEVPRRFLEAVAGREPIAGSDRTSGRLSLAQSIVKPDNPFVARVMVNRIWQHHFGRGIVASPDDFGVQGQRPTHPELLDWLAKSFIDNGWSMKKLHRELVLSNTYRMSSNLEPASEEKDPQNRLWHRMPIQRMEAEVIRDSLLMISGRLNPAMEGPGPLPHLTEFMVGRGRPGSGPLDGNGRRSIYLNVRRNFLNPMFLAFDYPIPFSSMGRRSVSNVPAQALAMMNNPFIIQQAELWGKRVLSVPGRSPRDRIVDMVETAFARTPTDTELTELLGFVQEQGREFGSVDDPRVWANVAHVLVNLKEFIFIP